MTSQTPDALRWLAYALFAVTLVPLGLAARELTRARRAAYYAVRRAALARGSRYLLLAILPPAIGVVLLAVPANLSRVIAPSPTPSPTLTVTSSLPPEPPQTEPPTLTPTRRATATAPTIPTVTPTRRPTATAPPIPSPTPTVAPPAIVLTPVASAVPPRPDAHIELLALASELDASGQPVDPGKEFAPGDHLVYLFFRYQAMDPGVPVAVAWYREGELGDFCTGTWLWDSVEDRIWGEAGTASVSCRPPTGWQEGSYEIRVYIGTALQGVAQFMIG